MQQRFGFELFTRTCTVAHAGQQSRMLDLFFLLVFSFGTSFLSILGASVALVFCWQALRVWIRRKLQLSLQINVPLEKNYFYNFSLFFSMTDLCFGFMFTGCIQCVGPLLEYRINQ